jgi:uncharacterized protein involved in exopolysaccharide biosynthesis
MKQRDNLLDVLRTIFRWRKPILIVTVVAAVGAVVISLLLPNFYEGKTTFLAVSPDQAKPEALFSNGQFRTQYYGNENDIDRLLTIANSGELINFMIDSFKLYQHYDIDPDAAKAELKVKEKFGKRYEIEKTSRDAIELSVEDRDPELAAAMANAARNKVGELARQLIRSGQQKTIVSYQSNIDNKEAQLLVLSDSLIRLRKTYGIYNIEGQSEALTTQLSETESKLVREEGRLNALRNAGSIPRDTIRFIEAEVSGLKAEYESLNQKMNRFNDGLAKVSTYDRQYLMANSTLSEDKEQLKQVLSVYEADIPALIVVENAEKPYDKSWPKRSYIVIGAVAIAFLFSVIGVLLLEAYRDIDWKEIYKGE